MPEDTATIAARLASRRPGVSEATVQADVRQFILSAALNLSADAVVPVSLESPLGDGTRRRIDIETGQTIIEIKRDLDAGNTLTSAEEQIGGYLRQRSDELGVRFLGILTDGREWRLYVLVPEGTTVIPAGPPFTLRTAADAPALIDWLGAILATREPVNPTPERVASQLGADSPTYAANHETLKALLAQHGSEPEVALKRELWVKLLRSAFGSSFEDDVALFVDHTLLVLTAEVIAHAVMGFDITVAGQITADQLSSGSLFSRAGIYGVVEADFFDWPAQTEEGRGFISSLARTVAAFNWSEVDHDVLKHLYESVISTDTRRDLGEYYTPDWLADRVLANIDYDPLQSRVLDASCGSGTFLFHAIQAYLSAADAADVPNGAALEGLVSKVIGMDLHPVAVSLARVTYLLAIGRTRILASDRPTSLAIPVYIGDSLQWERDRATLFAGADLVSVPTAGSNIMADDEAPTLFGEDTLDFPVTAMRDSHAFDLLVTKMSDTIQAGYNLSPAEMRNELQRVLSRRGLSSEDKATLVRTGERMWKLHIAGRDHIWGYYVRNLIRPVWLSLPNNRVDVLVGNPPWLRYNKMSTWMQARYRRLCEDRGLLSGGLGASGRDLAQLFVTRACEMYLRIDGQFGYVVPHSLLTRRSASGFRTGRWSLGRDDLPAMEGVGVFTEVWDLQHVSTGFPIPSGVVFGKLAAGSPQPMPTTVSRWTGSLNPPSQPWPAVSGRITTDSADLTAVSNDADRPRSPYAAMFRQGAILVPRRLMFVETGPASPLGAGAGRESVVSRTTPQDKVPWRVEPLRANVGTDFIYPVLMGESIAPFRVVHPLRAVLPIAGSVLLSVDEARGSDGLAGWWDQAERVWREHRKESESAPLCDRIDFHGQLSAQLEADRSVRVVYAASGNSIAAAVTTDPLTIVEHGLYWAPTESLDEARYLAAILNSAVLLELVKPLQAIGLFGPRHFDKYVFEVPFARFDATKDAHLRLAELAVEAEECAANVDVTGASTFQATRSMVRTRLGAARIQPQIDAAVAALVAPAVARMLEARVQE